MTTFEAFGLDEKILEAISYMGINQPTPIQQLAIPEILNGKDVLGVAQTGTGKTAAFILPVLHRLISHHNINEINTLIIVPTRELAIQIDQAIQGIAYFTNTNSLAIYGGGTGEDWDQEKRALTTGAEIIVATPGRMKAHLNMGYVKFDNVKHLILDEADRMLDIGFHEDIMSIVSFLPKERQTLLFSATMPNKVRELSKRILNNPVEVKTKISKPAEGIAQAIYLVYDNQKLSLITRIIEAKPDFDSIIIFSSTKKKVAEMVRSLRKAIGNVEGISSDLEQAEREEVLLRFRSKKTRVLVATDVLSRGIDIKDINLVINYDVPGDAEDYVHRVGRTARAKSTGMALTLVNEEDMYKFRVIEELIEKELPRMVVPADLGEGPEWNPSGRPRSKKPSFGNKSKSFHRKKNTKGRKPGKTDSNSRNS